MLSAEPTLVFDSGSVRRENGELVGNITNCSVAFARELLIRYVVHDELVAALRELVAAGDNSVNPKDDDDVAAMLRFGKADKAARAAIAKATT